MSLLSPDNTLVKGDLLADTYALLQLYSPEIRDLLPLILFKYRIHVSILTIHEFLSYFFYKVHDSNLINQIVDMFYKFYIVEDLSRDIVIRGSMILSDMVRHGITPDSTDVLNVAIALFKNIVILTTDPTRYAAYSKYGAVVLSVEEFIKNFKGELSET